MTIAVISGSSLDASDPSDSRSYTGYIGEALRRKFLINNHLHFEPKLNQINLTGAAACCILTPTSNRLLIVFCLHPGRVLRRGFLMDILWTNHGMVVSDNTLSKTISHLRTSLHAVDAEHIYIKTMNKIGYAFLGNVAVAT